MTDTRKWRDINEACRSFDCNGSHETHPWHVALDPVTLARHGATLTRTPYLTGSVAYASVTFPSIVAAADWSARERVSGSAEVSAHSVTFDRPVNVTLSWVSLG